MTTPSEHSELVEAEGHLVDSQLLNSIFDKVIERGAKFEVLQFDIGRTNDEFSHLKLKVTTGDAPGLRRLLEDLMPLGCHPVPEREAELTAAEADGVVADNFYSTTNHQTHVRHRGGWVKVSNQRMDGVIVIKAGAAACRKLRDVERGELVVCGVDGVRVSPEFRERDRLGFAFMTNDVSTERRVEVSAAKVVAMMRHVKRDGGRIAFVAGPVVVHSGGVSYLSDLVRRGYVDALLAGNALAVHDVERALYGTSLGVDLDAGVAVEEGHQNHMRGDQRHPAGGGLAAGGGRRPAFAGHHVRGHHGRSAVRAGREHSRRRSSAGYGDGTWSRHRIDTPRYWTASTWWSCCRRCSTASVSGTCWRRMCAWCASTSTQRS